MIRIISVSFLSAGAVLVAAGIIIFLATDCRAVLKDLATTRKLETDTGIDAVAQEAYYSNMVAYTSEDKPKAKGFRRKNRKNSSKDTDILGGAACSDAKQRRDEDDRGTKPLPYQENSVHECEGQKGGMQKGQTEPLTTLRSILLEADRAAQPAKNRSEKNGTHQHKQQKLQDATEPLRENPQNATEPLKANSKKEAGGTSPLHEERQTQHLKGFARHD